MQRIWWRTGRHHVWLVHVAHEVVGLLRLVLQVLLLLLMLLLECMLELLCHGAVKRHFWLESELIEGVRTCL